MDFNKVSKLSPEFNLSIPFWVFFTQHSWNCYYIRGQILFLLHLHTLVININAAVPCLNVKFKVNSEKIPEGMGTKIKPDLIREAMRSCIKSNPRVGIIVFGLRFKASD